MRNPVRQLYLAGPMSNLPACNYPVFMHAADLLRQRGHFVMNPAENEALPGTTWEEYMRMAIAQLIQCEAVAVLPNWETSNGATLEVTIAHRLHMPVLPWERWL